MVTTRTYPLTIEEFYSLAGEIVDNYPINEIGGDFFRLVRLDGNVILSTNPERRMVLIGNDEGKIEDLLKELGEKTGFWVH